jgi:hypothetical protein
MSNKFKIAHIKEQNQQIIIIPLDSSFGRKSDAEQLEAVQELQACANSAKLAGSVVVVWPEGSTFKFRAPNAWHPFFKSISYDRILASLNKELTCG